MEDAPGERNPASPVSPGGSPSAQHSAAAESCFAANSAAADAASSNSGSLDESSVERLLPPDYETMLSRAVAPVSYSSKSELYHLLCQSILIDEGRKSFFLERSTGKKCFLVSAREMRMAWGYDWRYWRWKSEPQISRFSQVAELLEVCWLHLQGRIQVKELSPRTLYAAYFVFRLKEDSYGLDGSQKATVAVGSHASHRTVCLQPCTDAADQDSFDAVPRPRGDGWMELELGEFMVADEEEDDEERVGFDLKEVETLNWKGGLVVEGVEVRPKL